jgi:rhodanese-related sulfurtransferase
MSQRGVDVLRALLGTLVIAGVFVAAGIGAPAAVGQPAGPVSIMHGTLMETGQQTPEVSTEELRQILNGGNAYVFDARPHLEYAISHIPGALNVAPKPGVPASLYVSDVAEIGRIVPDQEAAIVLYCNGPFCGKSKRLSEELLQAGYTNVRRYQLGAPTWRALVGTMQIELDGARYVLEGDRTAVFVDARSAEQFVGRSLPGARNIQLAQVEAAKDDGRLPMEDHNTRIIVFGSSAAEARSVAEAIGRNAFHNVAFLAEGFAEL